MVAMFALARRLEEFHMESLNLRYENRDLIEYLDRERKNAQALNAELQEEIGAREQIEKEIRRARDELEARVSERTSELMEINEELGWEISERKGIEEKLREGEAKYRTLVENVNSLIIRIDTNGRLTFLNEYAARFFGYSVEEALGAKVTDLIIPKRDSENRDMLSLMNDILTSPEFHETVEIENVRRDGDRVWINWTNKGLRNGNGKLTEIQCVGNDITRLKQAEDALRRSEAELKKAHDGLDRRVKERTEELARANVRLQEEIKERERVEEALRRQASHDYLTGVWNRKATMEALDKEISRCRRENTDAGVIMIDVDHFKRINDSEGHLAGDNALRQVAKKIQGQLRPYDWLGRYGGEEFLIILPGAAKEQAVMVSERIRNAIARAPIKINGGSVSITISLGVTTVREMAPPEVDTAIRNADTALYLAKENGRNRVECYNSRAPLQ
jgi:diguanylate cyclase (GGDEF)-like protein/PAS domain S-box-containing protein